ncbi:MAG TPA: serine/threonine-protein kinase [Chthoniobacteraceae bacterium]|jgi:serine/threonine protein kinase|nr:serine/threonine-protein kinase [Chthoniobacteraceae bacterium]
MPEEEDQSYLRLAATLPPGARPATGARRQLELAPYTGYSLPLPFQLEEWSLTEWLSQGGMGKTFVGVLGEPKNEAEAARKIVVKFPINTDEKMLERFRREIAILSVLQHPHIVRFERSGEVNVEVRGEQRLLPWFAMEFVEGQSLRAQLINRGRLPWPEVRGLLENILGALDYLAASQEQICHRDIKPDNIIHDPVSQSWKLVDFGIAKAILDDGVFTVTADQNGFGALAYMSPEQRCGKSVDIRSDIYSLGISAWEVLVGELPHPGARMPSARLGVERVPEDVDRLLSRMIAPLRVEGAPDVGDGRETRFETPQEALAALRHGAGVMAAKERRRRLRRRIETGLKVTAGCALLAAVAWFCGDQIQAGKAKEIYEAHRTSATGAKFALEKFAGEHWTWGHRYTAQKIAELAVQAAAEREAMRRQYDGLVAELDAPDRTDGAVSRKFILAANFGQTYAGPFAQSPEVQDIQSRKDALDVRLVAQKADELITSGQAARAVEMCDEHGRALVSQPAILALKELRARAAQAADRQTWQNLQKTVDLKNRDSILAAQAAALPLQRSLAVEMRAWWLGLDEALWAIQGAEAERALSRENVPAAIAALDLYLQNAGPKAHGEEARARKEQYATQQDESDWKNYGESVKGNLAARNYRGAVLDYHNYLRLHPAPAGRHSAEALAALPKMVHGHFDYLQEITAYEDFVAELRKLDELKSADWYRDQPPLLVKARATLGARAWQEECRLWESVADQKVPADVALRELEVLSNKRDLDLADAESRQYINAVATEFRAWIADRSLGNSIKARFRMEHPPAAWKVAPANRTVFHVSHLSVEVELSDADFEKLKGWTDCHPRVSLSLCKYDPKAHHPFAAPFYNAQGPANTRKFKITAPGDFYISPPDQVFEMILSDQDKYVDNPEGRLKGKISQRWFGPSMTYPSGQVWCSQSGTWTIDTDKGSHLKLTFTSD